MDNERENAMIDAKAVAKAAADSWLPPREKYYADANKNLAVVIERCINAAQQATKRPTRGEKIAYDHITAEGSCITFSGTPPLAGFRIITMPDMTASHAVTHIRCIIASLIDSEIIAAEKRGAEAERGLCNNEMPF